MHLLDTNVCISILRHPGAHADARLRKLEVGDVFLSAVTLTELIHGAWRSSRPAENIETVRLFVEPYECLAFDADCAEHAGEIRAQLAASGTPIGPYDVLIAATARAHRLTLVTHNTREFQRVVGLKLEDWESR